MSRKIKNIVSYLFLLLSGLLCALTLYIMNRFQQVTFEQLIYSLFYAKGSSINSIGEGIIICSIVVIIYLVIVLFPFYGKIHIKKKKIFPLNKGFLFPYAAYMFLLMFVVSGLYFGMFRFFYYQIDTTDLFDEYVDPREVEVSFPNKKKNLIYIFVESLEMSSVSRENGGLVLKSYIPNLEKIALENTNFSGSDGLGGALQVKGVTWTIGGMVAQTSGLPFKVLVHHNKYDNYSSFMQGAYSLGEILEKNEYKNYIMMGSDASFAGRKQYFLEHGNYKILDYNWAKSEKLFNNSYYEWWGFEDNKLFQYAKKELLEISKNDEPFNFTMLTADTHFPDGYIDKTCRIDKSFVGTSWYARSFYCCDKMIYNFLEWLKLQDFYDDTVVVISGDHLTMQNKFYEVDDWKKRSVYNVIINSNIDTEYDKNRLFTTMDMYPTTLVALGATIPGNKLGLGVDLYSGEKTLLEKYGYDYVNKEIDKKSKFYNQYILGNTYYEMYKNTNHEYED